MQTCKCWRRGTKNCIYQVLLYVTKLHYKTIASALRSNKLIIRLQKYQTVSLVDNIQAFLGFTVSWICCFVSKTRTNVEDFHISLKAFGSHGPNYGNVSFFPGSIKSITDCLDVRNYKSVQIVMFECKQVAKRWFIISPNQQLELRKQGRRVNSPVGRSNFECLNLQNNDTKTPEITFF